MTAAEREYSLADRYESIDSEVNLTGVQALARIPIDLMRRDRRAGKSTAAFVSGYPGSPLGSLDIELGRQSALLEALSIEFRPGLNEELAASAVAGSQLAHQRSDELVVTGVSGMWYGKAPGVDRAIDALRHGNVVGADHRGGVLILAGDDPNAKSSTAPCASETTLASIGSPVLAPADVQEALDLGIHAIEMSRASGLWVSMKIVTDVADGFGTVDVSLDRLTCIEPDLEIDGQPFRHTIRGLVLQPFSGEMERTLNRERPIIAQRYARVNGLDRIVERNRDDRIGIIAYGKTYLDLVQALDGMGLDRAERARRGLRLLKLGMIWPVEPSVVREFATGLDAIVVVEEKRSFVESAVKEILYGTPAPPVVVGKKTRDDAVMFPANGELAPSVIANTLAPWLIGQGSFPTLESWHRERAERTRSSRSLLPILRRTPYVCSGCPHSSSQPLPEDAMLGAGTGCSALTVLNRPDAAESGLHMQMGGEGAQWIGMQPFLSRRHMFQNMGDGTFHHSGQLAIRAAVAGKVNITYKLLYNAAVAMTGGQDPQGVMAVPQVAETLLASGVARVAITTDEPRKYRRVRLPKGVKVHHRRRILEIEKELASIPGVTVLIHDQECALQKRRKRKRGQVPDPESRIMINERICEGCGDCGTKSNCLSVIPIETTFGRKTQIHQGSCNVDQSCLDGDCPSFVTIKRSTESKTDRASGPPTPSTPIPDPTLLVPSDTYAVRIAGIGGTGIVTVAHILATAGELQGLNIRGMDQTGLSQKGGPVISDLKFSVQPFEKAARVDAEEADLLLGCDALVTSEARVLASCDPGRTVPIVSTSRTPTGAMVGDTTVAYPDLHDIEANIASVTRASDGAFIDAKGDTQSLLGDDVGANVYLLGAAFQAGTIPVDATNIEQAIRLNATSVEANLQVFEAGRRAILDRTSKAEESPTAELGLDDLIAGRISDLTDYQSARYARQYADFVERVRRAEDSAAPGSTALTRAVATYLHKLMAYKDEYEVARLSLDPTFERQVRQQFGDGAKITYRLHPPVLRVMGMRRKIAVGPRFKLVFQILRGMRFLRGTSFDPFGLGNLRRTERELITEYRAMLEDLLPDLTSEKLDLAVRIAELPDRIRGYENIKLRNVTEYREVASSFNESYHGGATRTRS